jgi:hypothetical protein
VETKLREVELMNHAALMSARSYLLGWNAGLQPFFRSDRRDGRPAMSGANRPLVGTNEDKFAGAHATTGGELRQVPWLRICTDWHAVASGDRVQKEALSMHRPSWCGSLLVVRGGWVKETS